MYACSMRTKMHLKYPRLRQSSDTIGTQGMLLNHIELLSNVICVSVSNVVYHRIICADVRRIDDKLRQ